MRRVAMKEAYTDVGGPVMTLPSIAAEPEELQRLAEAYDAAWTVLDKQDAIDALEKSAARERLGYIIVQIWQADPSAELSKKAVQLFRAGMAHAPAPRTDA